MADKTIEIKGVPAGGSFSGCGVYAENGKWYFNPAIATQHTTTFPYQCMIRYTVNGATIQQPVTIAKPVIIDPPLEDSVTCTGSLYLHAATLYVGAYEFQWSPANLLNQPDEANTTGQIQSTQTFVLTATDMASGCTGQDTVTISRDFIPELVLSPDTVILPGTKAHLRASGAFDYSWFPITWLDNPYSAHPVSAAQEDITYTVTGRSELGCTDTASVRVSIDKNIFIPNAFSPNGDRINDVFRIVNYGGYRLIAFRIFNRWGQEVFSTFNGHEGWDGSYNGRPQEAGTYYYQIVIDGGSSGVVTTMKGDLTLLR